MTIETLIRAVPPPAAPTGVFLGPWEPLEAEIGTALPQDYKDFVRLYGCGYFMEFLGIHVPRTRNPNIRLESNIPLICGLFSNVGDDELPYPMWPDPGGLLPFGRTDNGDDLFWLTRGTPEDWGVVVCDPRSLGFEAFDRDLTDFLAGLATGEFQPKEFPEDLVTCDHLFRPHSPDPMRRRLGLAPARAAEALFSVSWRMGGYGVGLSGLSTCRLRDDE